MAREISEDGPGVSGFFKTVIVLVVVASICIFGMSFCSRVSPGYVGVKAYSMGSAQGVDVEQVGVGLHYIGPFTQMYQFPTFTQNHIWKDDEAVKFQSEGMNLSSNVGIAYSVDPTKAALLFQKYRRGIDEITDTYIYNMVRDAMATEAAKMKIENVYSEGKAELMQRVETHVREQVVPIGLKIERIFWVGVIDLPPIVQEAVNNKIEATQKAQQRQNEIAEATAAAKKKIEEANGEAESIKLRGAAQAQANKEVAASITRELVNYTALQKWDGVLPRMTGSSPIPFLNLSDEFTPPTKPNTAN